MPQLLLVSSQPDKPWAGHRRGARAGRCPIGDHEAALGLAPFKSCMYIVSQPAILHPGRAFAISF